MSRRTVLLLVVSLLLVGCGDPARAPTILGVETGVAQAVPTKTPVPTLTAEAIPTPAPINPAEATPTSSPSPSPMPTLMPAPEVLYEAGASGGWEGWGGPSWHVAGDVLITDGTLEHASIVFAPVDLGSDADYSVEAEIQFVRHVGTSSDPRFGIVARSDGGDKGYLASINITDGPEASIVIPINKNYPDEVLVHDVFRLDNEWHTYRFDVSGNKLRFFIDNALWIETTSDKFLEGSKVGLSTYQVELNVGRFKVEKID